MKLLSGMGMRGRAGFGIAVGLSMLVFIGLGGCASGTLGSNKNSGLDLPKGRLELTRAEGNSAAFDLPTIETLQAGGVLPFSPLELHTAQGRFGFLTVAPHLGNRTVLRHSGEGILKGHQPGKVQAYTVRYWTSHADEAAARKKYPTLKNEHVQAGSNNVEALHWQYRMSLHFSADGKAFRVLSDEVLYHRPQPDGETAPTGKVPVLLVLAYRYPDATMSTGAQQVVLFEYSIDMSKDQFVGVPQLSNWIPLQTAAEKGPYSLEFAAMEVRGDPDEFSKRMIELVKNVRHFL